MDGRKRKTISPTPVWQYTAVQYNYKNSPTYIFKTFVSFSLHETIFILLQNCVEVNGNKLLKFWQTAWEEFDQFKLIELFKN